MPHRSCELEFARKKPLGKTAGRPETQQRTLAFPCHAADCTSTSLALHLPLRRTAVEVGKELTAPALPTLCTFPPVTCWPSPLSSGQPASVSSVLKGHDLLVGIHTTGSGKDARQDRVHTTGVQNSEFLNPKQNTQNTRCPDVPMWPHLLSESVFSGITLCGGTSPMLKRSSLICQGLGWSSASV